MLRTHPNEMLFSKEETDHVCRDIIYGDHGHGDDIPNHPGKRSKIQQMSGNAQEQHAHVSPCQVGIPVLFK